jgi:sugar O-acyltransferase (sialic acid O-acetyltransferase NeuD family)
MENNQREKIFVFGASGHAKVVIDIIERQGLYDIVCLVDDDPHLKGAEIFGYLVIGGKEELIAFRGVTGVAAGIVAIGSNAARRQVADWLTRREFRLVSAVHPSAQIARGVSIAGGSVVMAGAVLNSDAKLGAQVIVNSRASVDHDCQVGNCVHLAPGTILCGSVRVGDGTFLGAGTTVIPNVSIGSWVQVGAGATVVRDLPDGVMALGTPARIVAKKE